MPTRSELIHKAASFPIGDEERRSFLAELSKEGAGDIYVRREGTVTLNIRVMLYADTVGNVASAAKDLISNIAKAFMAAKTTIEGQGGRVSAPDMPSTEQLGIAAGRAGLTSDHYFYFKYEAPADVDPGPYATDVVRLLRKTLKANGVKV